MIGLSSSSGEIGLNGVCVLPGNLCGGSGGTTGRCTGPGGEGITGDGERIGVGTTGILSKPPGPVVDRGGTTNVGRGGTCGPLGAMTKGGGCATGGCTKRGLVGSLDIRKICIYSYLEVA